MTVPRGELPAPGSGTSGTRRRLGKRGVALTILGFVLVNGLAVVFLANTGSAQSGCDGGGFSGSGSGGSGIKCRANLVVTNIDAPDPVKRGGRLFYLVEIENRGPDAAGFIHVEDRLPDAMVVQWVMTSPRPYGSCSVQGRGLFCYFYGLQVYQKAAITIVLEPIRAGTYRNVAQAYGEATDPHPENNRASQATTVTR